MPLELEVETSTSSRAPTPIRDTAGQDRALERPRWKVRRRWLVFAVVGAAVIGGGGFAVKRWLAGERSVDGARLRIGEVMKGTLVRDAAVTGRVVAATMHSAAMTANRARIAPPTRPPSFRIGIPFVQAFVATPTVAS